MRLLLLQCSSIFEKIGGIESYLDDVAMLSMEIAETHTTVVAPHRAGKWAPLSRPYSTLRVRFGVNGTWYSKFQNRYSPAYFFKTLRETRARRPEFLVAAHVSLAPLTALLSRITGIPYLVVVYGIEAWGDLLPQDEWAMRRAHGIISISHFTKQRLVDRGYHSDAIQIIHPTIGPEFSSLPYVPKQRTPGPFRILSVSRLSAQERYKGQDHVLEALQLLNQRKTPVPIVYTIQGDGDDLPRLQAMVQEKGLGYQVQFQPPVAERTELIARYRDADLFVMPSRFGKWDGRWKGEGFGIVYAEAATAGTPSLAYECGGVTDIIEKGKTGLLVPPDDIDALANALEKAATQPQNLSLMGRAAFEQVHRKFGRTAVRAELQNALAVFTERCRGKKKAFQSLSLCEPT